MELRAQISLGIGPLGGCEWLEQVSSADGGSRSVEQIYLYVFGQWILVYGLLSFVSGAAIG